MQARRFGMSVRERAAAYIETPPAEKRDLGYLREAGFLIGERRRADRSMPNTIRKPDLVNFPIIEVDAMIFPKRTGMGQRGRR